VLGFDPRSYIIISAILSLLCAFIFFVLHRSFPKGIKGLATWGWGCLLMTAAAVLFASRSSIPLLFSSFLANVFVVGGIMHMFRSVGTFTGQATRRRYLLLVLAVMAMILYWPTFIDESYTMRIILVSTVNAGLFGGSAILINRMRQQGFAEWFTKTIFLFSAAISMVRCLSAIFQEGVSDPLKDVSLLQHVYLATFSFSLVALSMGFLLMVNRRLQLALEHASSHDDLTGVYRRAPFFEMLDKELSRSGRHARPLSVLMVDLDNFKAINDQYGHLEGDRVISAYSEKAQRVLRYGDVMGRYGGEEFIVLLPDTAPDDAYAIAERLRAAAAQVTSTDALPITVSIGIATSMQGNESAATLVGQADAALYSAKKAGKDCVEFVKQPPTQHALAASETCFLARVHD